MEQSSGGKRELSLFVIWVAIASLLVVTACGGGAGSSSTGAASTVPPTVTLAITPATIDFGQATVGQTSSAQGVTLTNPSAGSATISGIAATGDFKETNNCGTALPANGSCTINVVFAPTAVGSRTGSLSVNDTASNSPQSVGLTGIGNAPVVTPMAVTLSPSSLAFAQEQLNTTSAASPVTISNPNASAVTLAIAATGDFSQTNTCGSSLAGNSTCSISVTFTPTANGARSGNLTVTQSGVSTPMTVALSGTGAPVPGFGHVFIVLEENHDYSQVIGNTLEMPYLNNLASKYGLATQYYANTHPSIGNYFTLTTGQYITNDDAYTGTVPTSTDTIVHELDTAGKTWKTYQEDMPSVGYLGGDTNFYVKHHDPFAYFAEVINSTTLQQNLVPFSQFSKDLSAGTVPNFSFIVPNLLDDAHDGTLIQADLWLSNNIDPLIKSQGFQQDGLLIIVFDESATDNTNGGGRVAMVVVSSKSKPGYQSTTKYQHESTLRLILETLGIGSFPANSATAPDMGEFFH